MSHAHVSLLGDPGNTREPTLTEIGQGLRLEALTLTRVIDTLEEWGLGVQPRQHSSCTHPLS